MSSEHIQHVSDATFDSAILSSDPPAVVDFWANWCGPCRAISPAFSELADQYGDRIKIAKINVDENPQVPSNYAIKSIPAFLLFENGEVIARLVGAVPQTRLEELFERAAEAAT